MFLMAPGVSCYSGGETDQTLVRITRQERKILVMIIKGESKTLIVIIRQKRRH